MNMDEEKISIIMNAMKNAFVSKIEKTTLAFNAPMSFEQSKVQMPSDETWREYAIAILKELS